MNRAVQGNTIYIGIKYFPLRNKREICSNPDCVILQIYVTVFKIHNQHYIITSTLI